MNPEIQIRRALPGDTVRMWDITRDVWSGTDYLPFVWETWLSDADGMLMVLLENGTLVGLQHIDIQGDGVAWIEGIRVDGSSQGRGIGEHLLSAGLEWAGSRGCPIARLCTSSENPASNRIAMKAGMTLLGDYPTLRTGTLADWNAHGDVRLAGVTQFEEIVRFLATHRADGQADWIYTEGWTARTLTKERLRLLLAVNAVIISGTADVEAVAIATCTPLRPFVRLGLLAGTTEASQRLALWLRHRAGLVDLEGVRATIVGGDSAQEALQLAGYTTSRGHSMLLYERSLRDRPSIQGSVLQKAITSARPF